MFSDRLAELRKLNGLSQAKLADKIGVSQQTIAKWETNRTEPDIETIVKLAQFFSVTTDYLLDNKAAGDEEKPEPVTVAAHTESKISPEIEARIQELVEQAIKKYGGKRVE